MSFLHQFEYFFSSLALAGEMILEAISILCVLLGIVAASRHAIKRLRQRRRSQFPFIQIRLKFGLWLALALEFQLGADILKTTVSPTPEVLIQLAAIAVIRTFLNYFLNKEIETELELQERAVNHHYDRLFDDDKPSEKSSTNA